MSFSASLQRGSNFQSQVHATIAASSESTSVEMVGTGTDFLFENTGTVEVFVEIGGPTTVAIAGGSITAPTDGSLPVPAGGMLLANFSTAMTALRGAPPYVAAVTSMGTAVVRIAQGIGSTAVAKSQSSVSISGGTVDIGSGTITAPATITLMGIVTAAAIGNTNIATNQVAVDTTSGGTQIVGARATRNAVTIVNGGTITVFIGPSGVTAADGLPLLGVPGASVTIPTAAAIYGITSAGTQTVSELETYS